ncbi:MAG: type II toxin-antitoxin system RelE/ParE family toxin [Planctomycetota bacterium]
MVEIRESETYQKCYAGLRDLQAKQRIDMRIRRLALGQFGDAKSVGNGVSELRINYGPGYRLYYTQRGKTLVILLIGGDKSSQSKDIKMAVQISKTQKETIEHGPQNNALGRR